MARTKSSVMNCHSVPVITLRVPDHRVEIKEENSIKVCPNCNKTLNELYDADYDEHIGRCSGSAHVAPRVCTQVIASGGTSPLSTFSRSPSLVSEVPIAQAVYNDVDDSEYGLISKGEDERMNQKNIGVQHEASQKTSTDEILNADSVAVSPDSSPRGVPHASFLRINTYVTREVLRIFKGKITKRIEYVMEDYTESDDPVSGVLETLEGASTPIISADKYISSPMASGDLPYDSDLEIELPGFINAQVPQSQDSSMTAPTSKANTKRFQFKKLIPAETVVQYLSSLEAISYEDLYHRASQVANVLKDLQDEWESVDLKIREADAYTKAQVKEAKEAERTIDEQKVMEDEPELVKVLEEFEEFLRQREKGWKISLEQIQKTGIRESDPEKYARLLRLKAEPKLLKDITEKLARAQQPDYNRRYVSLRNPKHTIEAHKSDRLVKRSRLEPTVRWDDRKMMDAYGLPYSSAEGRVGDQFLPDQTKVDENGELVYENGRPKRSRAKRQVYDTEPSGAPSPEKSEEILPAKRRRVQRKHDDAENAINDDSSRAQTPPKKSGALAKALAAKKSPIGKSAKGAAAKLLKSKRSMIKASSLKPPVADESDDEENIVVTPFPEEDNLDLSEIVHEELDPEAVEAALEKVEGEDDGDLISDDEPDQQTLPHSTISSAKKRIGRPPKSKSRKKNARRPTKLEDESDAERAIEKDAGNQEANGEVDSEEEEADSRITRAQGQELEESVRSMMVHAHKAVPSHAPTTAKLAAPSRAKGKGGRAKKGTNADTNGDVDTLEGGEPGASLQSSKEKRKMPGKNKLLSSAYVLEDDDDQILVTTEQNDESRIASASTSRPTTATSRAMRSQSHTHSWQEGFPLSGAEIRPAATRKRGGKRKLKTGEENENEVVGKHEAEPTPPKKRKLVSKSTLDAIEVAVPSDVDISSDKPSWNEVSGLSESVDERILDGNLIFVADDRSVDQTIDVYMQTPQYKQGIQIQGPAKIRAKRGSRPGKRRTAAQTAALEADMKDADPEAFELYKAKKAAKSKKLSESASARWKAGLMDEPMAKRARTNAAKAAAKKSGGAMTPGISAADSGSEQFYQAPPHVPFSQGVFQAAPQPPVIQTQTLAAATRNSKRPRKPTIKAPPTRMSGAQAQAEKPRSQQMSTYDTFQALSAPGSPMVLEKRRSKKIVPMQMDENDEDEDDDYYGM